MIQELTFRIKGSSGARSGETLIENLGKFHAVSQGSTRGYHHTITYSIYNVCQSYPLHVCHRLFYQPTYALLFRCYKIFFEINMKFMKLKDRQENAAVVVVEASSLILLIVCLTIDR